MTTRWPTVPLGELCDEIYRYPSYYGIEYVASGIPEIRPELIGSEGAISPSDRGLRFIGDETSARFPRTTLHTDDLVMSVRGTIGKVALVPAQLDGANMTANLMRIEPDRSRLYPRYLWHFIRTPRTRVMLDHISPSTTIKTIRAPDLKSFKIPLPPLWEQKRIAGILDNADAIRRKRQESIRLTEEFLRSLFLDMFGDPVTNPKGWPVATIGSVVKAIDAGTCVAGEARWRDAEEWGVLKVSAVTSARFRSGECKVVGTSDVPPERIIPRRGDLLFSRANTREIVAASCLVEEDARRLFLPDKLWRIVPESGKILAEYLRFVLADPGFRYGIARQATGTSGSMLNVSQEKVRLLELPVPPVSAQKLFARVLWKCYDSGLQKSEAYSALMSLGWSLQHLAFTS